MRIRHTATHDLDRVMDIYAGARAFMATTGNPNQWGPTNWPPRSLIEADIAAHKSFVCEHEGRVVGVFFFDQGENFEPTYEVIDDGSWMSNTPYGVVHRIASDRSVPGIGRFCLTWAFEQCRHLRIDTHADNQVMQGLLIKLGFSRRGIIYVYEDHFPRIAFEKVDEGGGVISDASPTTEAGANQ